MQLVVIHLILLASAHKKVMTLSLLVMAVALGGEDSSHPIGDFSSDIPETSESDSEREDWENNENEHHR